MTHTVAVQFESVTFVQLMGFYETFYSTSLPLFREITSWEPTFFLVPFYEREKKKRTLWAGSIAPWYSVCLVCVVCVSTSPTPTPGMGSLISKAARKMRWFMLVSNWVSPPTQLPEHSTDAGQPQAAGAFASGFQKGLHSWRLSLVFWNRNQGWQRWTVLEYSHILEVCLFVSEFSLGC